MSYRQETYDIFLFEFLAISMEGLAISNEGLETFIPKKIDESEFLGIFTNLVGSTI